MAFSYTFHLSTKRHAVTSIGKLNSVSKHNLRLYKEKDGEEKKPAHDRSNIEVLAGSSTSILDDVKRIYHKEFDKALQDYNAKQKRADRRINDYLKHVSDSRSDVAAEIIIQLGDRDFWKGKPIEQKKKMAYIFRDQLKYLQRVCPEFKIASAVIHYEEDGESPHLHIVGVPVATGYKKGMAKQAAKTKVFTQDSLENLQDVMRLRVERGMEMNYDVFSGAALKDKEPGRNMDLPKRMLEEYYEQKKENEDLKKENKEQKKENEDLKKENEDLKKENAKLKQEKAALEDSVSDLKEEETSLKKANSAEAFKLEQAKGDVMLWETKAQWAEEDAQAAQKELAEVTLQVNAERQTLSETQNAVSTVKTELNDLSRQKREEHAETENLRLTKAGFQTEVRDLANKKNELNQEIGELEEKKEIMGTPEREGFFLDFLHEHKRSIYKLLRFAYKQADLEGSDDLYDIAKHFKTAFEKLFPSLRKDRER